MRDPWFKTKLKHSALGTALEVSVPHDVFSTQRIDEGTLLLLKHLPTGTPARILDMGCGYGALGLPIAARYPSAQIHMVDRDLLAVKWTEQNASANKLVNVEAYGSLGFERVRSDHAASEDGGYNWILCNVPARIGKLFIQDLFLAGRAQLSPGGDLRVVVINDLVPTLFAIKESTSLPLTEVARGHRHSVFSVLASPQAQPPESADLYLRDQVEIGGLKLDRPFDLGGDDPKRLTQGLPVLLDALPRELKGKVLCFRCGYGPLPLTSRARWPDAHVTAVDRDLLATAFTRRNAKKLGTEGPLLEIREHAHFPDALGADERFELIMGELSPSAGQEVAQAEILAAAHALAPGGQALILCLDKLEKEWVSPFAAKSKLSILPLLKRNGYTVLSFRGN